MAYLTKETLSDYVELYCSRCLNYNKNCSILAVHLDYNNANCDYVQGILEMLIPTEYNGTKNGNLKCSMFLNRILYEE